jgi:hypothetical protein
MPMCHANSLYFGLTFMYLGATIVVDDTRASTRGAARDAREGKGDLHVARAHALHHDAGPAGCREGEVRRRRGREAADLLGPARKDTKLAILEHFRNSGLYELYGPPRPDGSPAEAEEQIERLGSVGREWAGSGAIRILDPQGNEVPDGEVGELHSRTAYVFDGYWKNPDKTPSRSAANGARSATWRAATPTATSSWSTARAT